MNQKQAPTPLSSQPSISSDFFDSKNGSLIAPPPQRTGQHTRQQSSVTEETLLSMRKAMDNHF